MATTEAVFPGKQKRNFISRHIPGVDTRTLSYYPFPLSPGPDLESSVNN
jgi:hypothetical protein